MSLNRYEQAIFDYWTTQPDERRHWQGKADEASRRPAAPADIARDFERELWGYFVERRPHVPALRALQPGASASRVSLLNLAEHVVRLWGVPPKTHKPAVANE